MKAVFSLRRLAAASVLLLVCPTVARAAVTCTISTTSLNFGATYNVFSATPTDSLATITYSCSGNPFPNAGVPIRIALGAGGSGNFDDRTMTGPDAIHYNLFQDASRTVVWGDTAATDLDLVVSKANRGANLTATVYGRVPAQQDVGAGSYSDTITVTIVY
jgi:spore coat protein U-like protein